MLDIEIETEAVTKRLEAMTERIETFGHGDMPQGLTDWQVADMHRKYPETAIEQISNEEVSAKTMIYPRSRTYETTHPHRVRSIAIRQKPALSSMPVLKKSVLRHPILRPELFDKLFSRMTALLTEKITWR